MQLKFMAKQRGIRGYYKLRKAELIQALEAHSIVNEQVIPKFFFDESIPGDPTPVYNQHLGDHKISLLRIPTRSKILVSGC